ncbi:MAG TPA: MFS transporter [Pseudomonas sp.]|nr:MFS transporter [Pseudomonas sp.]
MTENDYLLAWSAYGVAALGCLLVWFQMTGWMWRWLREPLRLLVAVLLFTPTVVDPGKDALAPAIAITAMDLLLDVGDNAWRAVADLTSYGMIVFVVYLVFAGIRWPIESAIRRKRVTKPNAKVKANPRTAAGAVEEDEPTLREIMEQGNTWIDPQGDRRLRIEPRI